jgi:hypothetical protein
VGPNNILGLTTLQVVGTTTTVVGGGGVSGISNTNPALAYLNGHLYYVWLGTDRRINITSPF